MASLQMIHKSLKIEDSNKRVTSNFFQIFNFSVSFFSPIEVKGTRGQVGR